MSSKLASAVETVAPRRLRVVWGIEHPGGIAETINRTPAQTRWLIKNGKLRVKQHGEKEREVATTAVE